MVTIIKMALAIRCNQMLWSGAAPAASTLGAIAQAIGTNRSTRADCTASWGADHSRAADVHAARGAPGPLDPPRVLA